MTVLENILVGLHNIKTSEEELKNKAFKLLKLFNMESMAYLQAGNLSYGVQRRLEILRALAANPKILFLDEPAA